LKEEALLFDGTGPTFNEKITFIGRSIMNKRTLFILLLLTALLWPVSAVYAAAPAWTVDPPHSSIRFSVQHIYATVWGNFDDYTGTIRFDPNDLATSSIAFTIEPKSIQTGVAKRDSDLRSRNFFDVDKYPTIDFASTAIRHLEGDRYEVAGRLTIKDVSREVVLPMVYHGSKDHPMMPGNLVAGFDIDTTLDRLAYHVGNGSYFQRGIIGKDIAIYVSVEMLRPKP